MPRSWTFLFSERSSRCGRVVEAGDINGDGWPDLLVSAPKLMNGTAHFGGMLLFFGSAAGFPPAPSQRVTGLYKEPRTMGQQVSGVWDFNGDGFGDVLVGIPRTATPDKNSLGVFLYAGSSSGLASKPVARFLFHAPAPIDDAHVCLAGDVNADGFQDVLVGAPFLSPGQTGGVLWLVYGSATGLVQETAQDLQAENPFSSRYAFAGAGDLNGDGYADVIAGSPLFRKGNDQPGAAYVIYGSANGVEKKAGWVTYGSQNRGHFGAVVCGRGDVNGDGWRDVAVGAPERDREAPGPGRVFVFPGSPHGLSKTPAWSATGEKPGAAFGMAIANVGDVNGDGFADLLISANEYSGAYPQEGRVYLYLGSTSGLNTKPALTVDGGIAGARYGLFVAGAGDVDRDGLDDFLIGSPLYGTGLREQAGRVDLFYGSRESYQEPLHLVANGNSFRQSAPNTTSSPSTIVGPIQKGPIKSSLWPWLISGMVLLACAGGMSWLWHHRTLAIKRERERIARDLHDEVGVHLTQLALLGRTTPGGDPRQTRQLEDVSTTAREIARAFEQAVWAVQPGKETLESLVSFLAAQAPKFFAGSHTRCLLDLPISVPEHKLSDDVRKNLLMAVKESLNNVAKHAQATEVHLRLRLDGDRLQIEIEDNGIGLCAANERSAGVNPAIVSTGLGLHNLRERIAAMGGELKVVPGNGSGTRVCVQVKL